MLIDYQARKSYEATIQIDDIGNCALICSGEYKDGKFKTPGQWVIILNTVMGKTTVLKWGPFLSDIPVLPNTFSLTVKQFAYKENIIEKELSMFLNDPQKGIYEAKEILKEEALELLPENKNYLETLN